MIEVHVQKALGGFRLDTRFEAPAGVTVLFGASGSGKTSVVNAVAGLLRPDAGRIVVGGRVLFDGSARVALPARQRSVGYVFQDARLFPHMTVARNLAYGGRHDWDRVIGMLGLGGLLERRPASLSGGERQRVALGRALMSGPRLMLMDEPLAALDAARKALILPYLERLRDEVDVPILYVTHDVAEAARLGSTMVVMEAGRAVRIGPVSEVLSEPGAAAAGLAGRDVGAVLEGVVTAMAEDGLAEVATPAGPLLIGGTRGQPGDRLRLRLPAQEVILSMAPPSGLSALNILSGEVAGVTRQGGWVDVLVTVQKARIVARITERSAARLGIEAGAQVHAIVKAMAVGPEGLR